MRRLKNLPSQLVNGVKGLMMEHESNQNCARWLMIVAATFCLVAVCELPYGFYRLLRWITCGAAVAAAFQLYSSRRYNMVWIAGAVGLIFNPISPFFFPRNAWRIIDAGAAVSFFVFFFATRKRPVGGTVS